jgi:hypothetical protein
MMPNMIDLPNGESIRSDCITAIRLGDARPAISEYECNLKPRVILDFGAGNHLNCVVLDCASVEERDALAKQIREQL